MVSIGPKIQITGETAYRQSLNRIVSTTKEFKSELDLCVAKFSKWESAMSKNAKEQTAIKDLIKQTTTQYDAFKGALDKATQKFNDANTAYDEQKKKIAGLLSEQKRLEDSVAALERAGSKYGATWEGVNGMLAENKQDVADAEKELAKLSQEIDRSGKVMEDWKTTVNNTEIEILQLKDRLGELPNSLEIVGGYISTAGQGIEKLGGMISTAGEKISEFGGTVSKYVTAPLVALGTYGVKNAASFEDGMAKIYTIAEESKKPMAEMREELLALSSETGFDLGDLAEAEYQAVSASVDTADAVTFLAQAAKLARAGFTSTTDSVDVLSTVMNSYGKEVYDASYISDVLLKTQNDGKVVVDELAAGLGTIIPLASAYNVGLEDVSGALATMTKQGVPANKAITFLRAMFTELEKSSSGVSKTLKTKTNKSFAQLMDEGNNLADVLKILYRSVDNDAEKFAQLFGNVRSSQAVATLLADDFGILTNEIDRMYDSVGQTDYALEILETPALKAKRALNQLKNSTVELGTTMINEFYPYFQQVVDAIKKGTEWFSALDEDTKTMIVNWGLTAAAAGPVIVGVGKVVGAVGTLVTGFGKGIDMIGKFTTGCGDVSKALLDFSAYATQKGGAISGLSGISGVLGKIVGYTPGILLGVGAVAGLSVAIKESVDAQMEETAALHGMGEEAHNSIETMQQLHTEHQNAISAIYAEKDATLEGLLVAQQLAEEYNTHIDTYGKVKQGHEEVADIILTKMAEAMGVEKQDVEDMIEANGRFGQSLRDNIEDLRKRAEANAYTELMTEAIKVQTQAEKERETQEKALEEQHQRVIDAEKAYKDIQDKVNEATKDGSEISRKMERELSAASDAVARAKEDEKALEDALRATNTEISNASAEVEFYSKKLSGDVEQGMEDAKTAVDEGGKDIVNSVQNIGADSVAAFETADTDSAAYYFATGLSSAIDKYAWIPRDSAYAMGAATLHGLNAGIQVASPSKLTFQSGKYFGEGFVNGIEAMKREAMNAATGFADAALYGIDTVESMATVSNTVSAPINISLTVNGNVDDPNEFGRSIGQTLADLISRENEVFA